MNIDQTLHGGDSRLIIEGSPDLNNVRTHLSMSECTKPGGTH